MKRTYWAAPAQRHGNPAFSMSFLDLLANTLGTLIFIMIVLFLQVSQLTDRPVVTAEPGEPPAPLPPSSTAPEDRVEELRARGEILGQKLREAEAERTGYEAQLSDNPEVPRQELAAARAEVRRRREEMQKLEKGVEEARLSRRTAEEQRDRAAEAKKSESRMAFPTGRGSAETRRITEFYHVVCDRGGLVITHQPSRGAREMDGARVALSDVEKENTAFRRAVAGVRRSPDNSMIVFWVKPSGLDSYERVNGLLAGEPLVKRGDEPADENLSFQAKSGGK
ncbi:MAG: hypothetical protein HYY93_01975 [Planctomycetes bacterium]|nr:hypothetical protein [Planctomycetota bacterium]